jgi:helix-turn-helix protein
MTSSMPRRFLAVLEPISAMIFFSPEAFEAFTALGLDAWSNYFSSRAAPMGAVAPEVVVATFYNFSPDIVRPNVRWDIASPERILQARHEAVRRTLHRVFDGDDALPNLARAVELLQVAVAACAPQGRPLGAAHARLPWPEDELEGVWHGATVLREFRGDGHIAALLGHAVGPVEAILLHAAYIGGKLDFLKLTRQWDDAAIEAGVASLVDRGFMTPEKTLTDAGHKFRLMLEHDTDRMAEAPFKALGEERCEELLEMLHPMAVKLLAERVAPKALGRMDPVNLLV